MRALRHAEHPAKEADMQTLRVNFRSEWMAWPSETAVRSFTTLTGCSKS